MGSQTPTIPDQLSHLEVICQEIGAAATILNGFGFTNPVHKELERQCSVSNVTRVKIELPFRCNFVMTAISKVYCTTYLLHQMCF